jgi:peptidyl-prolyl cis-trans isomerase SurA
MDVYTVSPMFGGSTSPAPVPRSARALLVFGALLALSLMTTGAAIAQDAPRDAASDPVVAVIAGDTLTQTEFSAWYERSATSVSSADQPDAGTTDAAPESPNEFLKRYVDFRLKVQAARDAGLDTLASLQQEIDSYRRQIARPTLMRKEILGPIVRTMYERRAEEIEVSHILIAVEPDASPSDTVSAYREMESIVDSLDSGTSFAAMARRNSDDPSAKRENGPGAGGRLGYMTAGRLVEPFEDAMYATPVGERSNIFRTQYGFHVLRVHDRRERSQPVRIAHILIRPDSTTDSTAARAEADSLRTLLTSGEARFDSLATRHSDDTRTARRGGELGVLQPGQNVPVAFREAAFALAEPGDVSPVISTRFGAHLIQLLERKERPSFEDAYDDLSSTVSRMPRVAHREQEVARRFMKQQGASIDTSALAAAAHGSPEALDSLASPLARMTAGEADTDAQIGVLGDSTITLGRVAEYVRSTRGARQQTIRDLASAFMDDYAIQLAALSLEERDPDVRRKMDEYRDGLLLFEFMQERVWTPASQDTSALRRTYREHSDRYRYPQRVRVLRLSASADSNLIPYAERLESGGTSVDLAESVTSDSLVQADTLFLADGVPERQQAVMDAANNTAVGPVDGNGRRVLYVRTGTVPSRGMTFDEARSRVIRDYQEAYEQEVLSRLRDRYEVRTFPENLPDVDATASTETP